MDAAHNQSPFINPFLAPKAGSSPEEKLSGPDAGGTPFGRRATDPKPDFLPVGENGENPFAPSPFDSQTRPTFPPSGDIPMAPLAPAMPEGFEAPKPAFPDAANALSPLDRVPHPFAPPEESPFPSPLGNAPDNDIDSDADSNPLNSKQPEPPRAPALQSPPPSPASPPVRKAAEPQGACLITTTPEIADRKVREYLGLVSTHIAVPKDILLSNPAPQGPLNRLKAAETQIQKVLEMASQELAEKARAKGADAVIGVRVDFANFDAVVSLCSATGTAVILE